MSDYDPSKQSTLQLQAGLARHVLMKGYQAGGLIGLVAVVPLQTLLSRSFSLPRAAKAVGISSVVGVGITSALLAAKATQIDRVGYEDRVYRLHYNEGQNRVDRLSTWGALLGLAASAYAARSGRLPSSALHLLGGSGAGSALGVLLHVATMPGGKEQRRQAISTVKDQLTPGQ